MTFTDKELDATLLGAIGRAWGHEKNTSKEMDPDLAEAVLFEIREIVTKYNPIGEVIMRDRAAALLSTFDISEDEAEDGVSFCRDAPSRVFSERIRQLPLPAHAEILAHALELPEVKALIAAGAMAWQGLVGEYSYYKASASFCELEKALDALAALEPKP